jgi:hypothetical protein
MPVTEPDKFVLYINMDATAAGGIAVPATLMKQADQILTQKPG